MKVLQYLLIAFSNTMMRFINDDGIKIRFREGIKPPFTHQCLYGSDNDPKELTFTGLLGFFNRTSQTGGFFDLIRSLIKEFSPMRQDQYSFAFSYTGLGYRGENYSFSGSCRKNKKCSGLSFLPFFKHSSFCLFLICSQLQH